MGTKSFNLIGVAAGQATITASDGTPRNTITAEIEAEVVATGEFNTHYEGTQASNWGETETITFTYTSPDPSNPIDPADISLNIIGDTNNYVSISNRQNSSGQITFSITYNPGAGVEVPGAFQIEAVYDGNVLDTMNFYAIQAEFDPIQPALRYEQEVPVTVTYAPTTVPYQYFFCNYSDSEGNVEFTYSSSTPGTLNVGMTDNGGEQQLYIDLRYSEIQNNNNWIAECSTVSGDNE